MPDFSPLTPHPTTNAPQSQFTPPPGVDVAGLLSRMGLAVSDTSEKVGTFAIAYAAHKALSPVRFPPTVALTPVVARWFGQKKEGGDASSNGNGKAE